MTALSNTLHCRLHLYTFATSLLLCLRLGFLSPPKSVISVCATPRTRPSRTASCC
ncbi:hypothetical protein PF005_g16169 [Phytophthora fragariae]|uniref:Uncharacterized protein n=1 Tax=Phytophthora fragariae TaxID=53985 RepID=A0A6A3EI53_9STRA|nr:hypothetical protein PF003_g840 [Phytophthora fragariae]KAE8932133.1 hypothetical protein PF009_g17828 [Phytophthora fragariae]KAE8997404.1 hypothetical protein PF011_g15503 [Phytophthora fragariae]KAE9096771.1 hypothetical protein PF007_g16867 [Phytophthora fragariae]KAE9109726.1 hypothetical protein PF010_g11434 [Phytophthora fragariae]